MSRKQIGLKLDEEMIAALDAAVGRRGTKDRTAVVEAAIRLWLSVPDDSNADRAVRPPPGRADPVVEARRRGEVEPRFGTKVSSGADSPKPTTSRKVRR